MYSKHSQQNVSVIISCDIYQWSDKMSTDHRECIGNVTIITSILVINSIKMT